MSETSDLSPPVKRRRRLWLWVILGVTMLALTGVFAAMSLVGTQLRAPEWVRQKIIERVNDGSTDYAIDVAEVAIVLQEGWTPRLFLRDVRVADALGAPIVNLSDVAGSVALRPLLRGQLQPAKISLSGARLNLRRAPDGTVDLSLGESDSSVDQAASFAALARDVGAFLDQPQFATLRRINAENLTVRFEDLRARRAWTVDGGRLALSRDGDNLNIRGDFALLGGRATATTLSMNYDGRIGSPAADFGISFQDMDTADIAGQSPALAWLGALRAPISGALRASVDNTGGLGPLNATLQIGKGVLQPTDVTQPIAFSSARCYFTYDPTTQTMQFNELSVVSDWVSARAEGGATLLGIENGFPRELLGQIRLTQISANPNDLYPEPITVEGASMDLRLKINPFQLSLGQLSLADQGSRLLMSGELSAEADGWNLALDGRMDSLTPVRLLELWPETLEKGTRQWIDRNVAAADLQNLQFALRARPDNAPDVFLGFDFEGLETRFIKEMPPIIGAKGHASLYDNRFAITAASGQVTPPQGGRIDISGTSFIVPDVRIKRAPARTLLHTDSTITAALSLLDEEPFGFLTKAGRPVTLADGRARLSGQLDFLLKKQLKTTEVAFDVTGVLSGVRSEVLVPGRVLSAATLKVRAGNETLTVGGTGQLGAVPFRGQWQSDLEENPDGMSRFTGKVELSERFSDEFNIGLPPGSISGSGQADITVEMARDVPGRFSLSSDLLGVGLRLRALDWVLPQSESGSLIVAGQLGEPPVIDTISIDAAGLDAEGAVSLHPNGSLNKASFSQVELGAWLRAPVDLIGRGAGVAPAVRVRGGRIDLRETTLGDNEPDASGRAGDGGPVSLALDRLVITDGIALTDFRAELETSRGLDGNFTGKINSGAVINGRIVPHQGRSAFRIQSDNAGAVLISAGLLQNARDGKMDLILTPAPEKGSYNGRLSVDNFRIKDAPSLAALLNAVSVIGLLETWQKEGLHFYRLDAEFHLSPDKVTLTQGSATGASLGISMDGYYYMASKQMDMQGVFSPIYLVNAIGGVLTRRGEGLFGFTYTIKGPASNPSVSVNPLSALTPGMFRNIFRREPPKIVRDPALPDGAPTPSEETANEPIDDRVPDR